MFGGASNIADEVDLAFLVIVSISVVLLCLITFLMIFFVIKYSRKRNPTPTQIKSNVLLEVIWTVIPTILVLIMFYYGWKGFDLMRTVPENTMVVKVTARMWSWLFEYENGKSDDTLFVPLNQPVKLALGSTDVIHSLFIPAFRIKEDAVPGMETHLWFTPTETGSYDLFCAEYCGVQHSAMLSKVVVLPTEDFAEWYDLEEGPGGETQEAGPQGALLLQSKGCIACHSTDGSPLVGPSLSNIFGRRTTVITDGEEREVVTDEDYLRRSILEPSADVVKDFPPIMPPQGDMLTEEELDTLIQYIKEIE